MPKPPEEIVRDLHEVAGKDVDLLVLTLPTIELMGREAAVDLTKARVELAMVDHRADSYVNADALPAHINTYFQSHGDVHYSFMKAFQDFDAAKDIDTFQVVCDLYAAHEGEADLMPADMFEADVAMVKAALSGANQLDLEIYGLLARWNASADRVEKEAIWKQAQSRIDEVHAYQVLYQRLSDYSAVVTLLSDLERLDYNAGHDIRMMKGCFLRGIRDSDVAESNDISYRFPSQRQRDLLFRSFNKVDAAAVSVATLAPLLIHVDRMKDEVRYWKQQELFDSGARAIAVAEAALADEAVELHAYPFSALDQNSESFEQEFRAMKLLAQESRMATVHKEVRAFMSGNLMSTQRPEEIQALWATLDQRQAEWQESVANARELAGRIIGRSLGALAVRAEPIVKLAQGGMTRAPKTNKSKGAKQSEENTRRAAAEHIYRTLHQQDNFTSVEKAVIAAAASGGWPQLKELSEGFINNYQEILHFATRTNQRSVVNNSVSLKTAVQFSPREIFAAIHDKLARSARPLLSSLTADQQRLFEAAMNDQLSVSD